MLKRYPDNPYQTDIRAAFYSFLTEKYSGKPSLFVKEALEEVRRQIKEKYSHHEEIEDALKGLNEFLDKEYSGSSTQFILEALEQVEILLRGGRQNYYALLRVSPEASTEEIHAAYRSVSKEYHPDRHLGDENMEKLFKNILTAYEVLSDPDKRAIYDRFGVAGFWKIPVELE